ncbi:hypothetical protein GUJ93_ZPchr0009g2101 [Zizania palustris]|uniref:DNA-directed RNA polymerases I and III subunit RPAC2 n=1 Tax=Zizania palustris TaxID=103762 RepID=A0A8J5RQP6_ZIZPA|nr:hypothetical protein GUJ93_ZPchr0009g2101 [Zizania palustris]
MEHGSVTDSTASSFSIMEEDHTLANSVRFVLNQDPRVAFCGYSIPHPADKKVNIRVQTTGDSAKDVLKDSLQDLMVMCQHVRGTFDTAVSDFQQNKTAEGVDIDLNKKKSIPLHVFPSSLERSDMESSDGTLVYSRTSVVESYGKGSDASSTASVQSGFDNGQEFGKRLRARSLLYHQVKLMVGLVKSVGTGDLTTADVTDAPPMAHLLVVSTLPT